MQYFQIKYPITHMARAKNARQKEVTVLNFPSPATARVKLTLWQKLRGAVYMGMLKFVRLLNMPGIVQDTEFDDMVTGRHIRIRRGLFFTQISVDGRDYFFHRITGRYDGSGMGCG